MKTSDFNFHLPSELIAQTPLAQRDQSRLLYLNRHTGEVSHEQFFQLPNHLQKGDCLILNDSRVLPARLLGQRAGGGKAEILLLSQKSEHLWECLVNPGKRLRQGATVTFGNGELVATIAEVLENGNRLVEFSYQGIFLEILDKLGNMPLPPYIKAQLEDKERYQTVYSKEVGSAAAPTAGLHFTEDLLHQLRKQGVSIGFVTLHVGLGTFRPVQVEDLDSHKMHSEFCQISEETAQLVNETKALGGRIFSVGTTSCRSLESFATVDGTLKAGSGWTDIFIYPSYEFKVVDALLTNFHLPESTLIMLVSALAGKKQVLDAYNIAVDEKYRFFSFGDAMLIM